MVKTTKEVKCFLCGEVSGHIIGNIFYLNGPVPQPSHWRPWLRCGRCGGSLYVETTETHIPVPEIARLATNGTGENHEEDLGANGQASHLEHQERKPRSCIGCGAPVVKAVRCRRCYVRHRYATDPAYRARQLAMQENWRRRRQSLRSLTT